MTDIDLLLPKTASYLREASYIKDQRQKYDQNSQSKLGAYNMLKFSLPKGACSVSRDLTSGKKMLKYDVLSHEKRDDPVKWDLTFLKQDPGKAGRRFSI